MAYDKDTPRKRKTIDQHIELLKQRTEATKASKPSGQTEPKARAPRKAVVKQLPIWPDAVRAVPNGILRSALFGAIAKGRRRLMDNELVASTADSQIRATGPRLDQGDLDVWMTVLHVVRFNDLGSECRMTAYSLLKLLGKTDSGKNRVTLQARITRLVASGLSVKQGRHTYIGTLISEAAKDDETQEWVIRLNPKLRPLFDDDQFTQTEWLVRHELDGKPLAQWLHGFYATHADPFPLKVETLHKLCGSEAEIRRFRQTLGDALVAVTEASAKHGEAFSFDVRGDLVHVEKKANRSRRLTAAQKAIGAGKPRS